MCILGDDDTLEPEYLATCLSALDESGAAIAYTQVMGRNARGQTTGAYIPPAVVTLNAMRERNYIWSSSVVRREWWELVNGYDMSIPYVHDYDFWVRCLKAGARAEYVPIVGWNHYAHDEGRVTTTTDKTLAWKAFDERHPHFRNANWDSISVVY